MKAPVTCSDAPDAPSGNCGRYLQVFRLDQEVGHQQNLTSHTPIPF
jgi:hypothetical protein